MSGDDWQVGDLALCISPRSWEPPEACDPHAGTILTVSALDHTDPCGLGLWFDGVSSCDSYMAYAFRKIRPHTPDEEDRETIELLTGNRAPIREGV